MTTTFYSTKRNANVSIANSKVCGYRISNDIMKKGYSDSVRMLVLLVLVMLIGLTTAEVKILILLKVLKTSSILIGKDLSQGLFMKKNKPPKVSVVSITALVRGIVRL